MPVQLTDIYRFEFRISWNYSSYFAVWCIWRLIRRGRCRPNVQNTMWLLPCSFCMCVCVWCPLNQMPFRLAFLCKLPVQCSEIIVHRVSLSMLCRCCRFLSSLIKDCSTSAQVSYIFTLSFRPFLSESVFHYSVTPRQIQHCGIGASAQRMILFVKIYNMWRSINHRGAGWSWWQMILFALELIIIYYLINHWYLVSLQATSCTANVADSALQGSALQPTRGLTGTSVRLELICYPDSRLPHHQYLVYVIHDVSYLNPLHFRERASCLPNSQRDHRISFDVCYSACWDSITGLFQSYPF